MKTNTLYDVLRAILVTLLIACPFVGNGQSANREFSYGVNINSDSYFIGGFDVRLKYNWNSFYNFEVVNIKHPNEFRIIPGATGNNILGQRAFIVGKNNYLISFRFQWGREIPFFQPAENNGVRISGILAGGASIGLVKPYYIKYLKPSEEVVIEQFSWNAHNINRVQGPLGLFYGLENSTIRPGLNIKGGVLFEYLSLGKTKVNIEAGALLEFFAQRIELIEFAEQKFMYPSVYVILSIGRNKEMFREV